VVESVLDLGGVALQFFRDPARVPRPMRCGDRAAEAASSWWKSQRPYLNASAKSACHERGQRAFHKSPVVRDQGHWSLRQLRQCRLDKASTENERNAVWIRSARGDVKSATPG